MNGIRTQATVLDTSVLSNFAHVSRVDVLLELPRTVTTDVVRSELQAGVETHPYLDRALSVLGNDIPVLESDSVARDIEEELGETLDPGEAQVLAIAEAANGIAVTDDGDAREIAARRDIPVTGSIGILVRVVEDDVISVDTADSSLKRWIDEAGFRAPARDIEVFLGE